MRKLNITALTCVLVLGAFCSCTSEKQVRFMSYDVDDCRGLDGIRNVQRIAEIIALQHPDAVALQGLDSVAVGADTGYTLGELATATGMHSTWCPAMSLPGGGKRGVGILSKQEPLSVYIVPIKGGKSGNALLVVEFKKYYFGSAVFARSIFDRMASASTLKETAQTLDKPFFFGGSLNAGLGSQTIEGIMRDFTPLVDLSARTWPADSPTALLDYLFMYNHNLRKFTIDATETLDEPVASSHRPVVAGISFK